MTKEEVREQYIQTVKQLPIVKDIQVEGDIITTIIEAPPFESTYTGPIYQAQVEAYRQMSNVAVCSECKRPYNLEFHVRNILEETS